MWFSNFRRRILFSCRPKIDAEPCREQDVLTISMAQDSETDNRKWHQGITRYQWLVLLIASLGWVFDIFEGQIFVASMRDAMPDLLGVPADHETVRGWNDLAFVFFLLGGAFGGVIFGMISDQEDKIVVVGKIPDRLERRLIHRQHVGAGTDKSALLCCFFVISHKKTYMFPCCPYSHADKYDQKNIQEVGGTIID